MLNLATFLSLTFICLVSARDLNYYLSNEFIDSINKQNLTWKAGRNFHPDINREFLEGLLGSLPHDGRTVLPKKEPVLVKRGEIPETFDAREHWPHCTTIREIRDQGGCGSCWAIAAVEAMSDRICIHKNQTVHLSTENLMTCYKGFFGHGCKGGVFPYFAWKYWATTGIVTGGGYGSHQGCQPYKIPPCGDNPDCTEIKVTPKCELKCEEGYSKPYKQDLHFGKMPYFLIPDVEQIQVEIMNNGPVETIFIVLSDFYSYKSGVYQHTEGKYEGLHAVKIIGWGEENGTPYWLVANSWGDNWGEHGFFKFLRGENHCLIETFIVAGIPK